MFFDTLLKDGSIGSVKSLYRVVEKRLAPYNLKVRKDLRKKVKHTVNIIVSLRQAILFVQSNLCCLSRNPRLFIVDILKKHPGCFRYYIICRSSAEQEHIGCRR